MPHYPLHFVAILSSQKNQGWHWSMSSSLLSSFPKMEEIGLRFCYGLETLGLFHPVNYPFSSVLTKPLYFLGKSIPRPSMTDTGGTLREFHPSVFIQHLISIYWMALDVWNIFIFGFEIPLAICDCNFVNGYRNIQKYRRYSELRPIYSFTTETSNIQFAFSTY